METIADAKHNAGSCHGRPCIASAFRRDCRSGDTPLKDLNSDALSNTMWAFATVDHESLDLQMKIAEVARDRSKDLDSHALAIIVGAFATASHASPELWTRLQR